MELGNSVSETIRDKVLVNLWAKTAHNANSIIHKNINDIVFDVLEEPLIWTRSILSTL